MVNLLWLSPENGLYSRSSCSVFGLYFIVFGVFFFFYWFFCEVFFFFFFGHACRIFVPQPGMNPCPQEWKHRAPNYWATKEFLFIKRIYLYIYTFVHSLLAVLGLCRCTRASSCCGAQASHGGGFSCCGVHTPVPQASGSCSSLAQWLLLSGFRAQAQYLWCRGLVVPSHVESSRTRDQTQITPLNWKADS